MKQKWEELFAETVQGYQGYAIGKTIKYLTDPEIISLAGGLPSPDVFQRTELRAAASRILDQDINLIMQYSPIPGEARLFDAIIKFLARDGIAVERENIVITTSGQHGLDLTGRLFLSPGDVVLVDRPTFAGALAAFDIQQPVYLGVDIEPDGSDVAEMQRQLVLLSKEGRKPKFIYVVPDFQNPTGITMSLDKRKALLDLGREYDVPIVEDSPYRDLRYSGETIPAIYSLDQESGGGNVIGLYTFSKIFCPGLRVGFNVGPAEVVAKMTCLKEGNILNTPKLNQDLCLAFLEDMDFEAHIKECRDYYRDKLSLFLKALEEHFPPESGVTWTRPEGGLFLWMSLPEKIDTAKLFFDALKHKVAFVPGEQFYGENPDRMHMRINFSFVAKDQLVEAVRRLAACIREAS